MEITYLKGWNRGKDALLSSIAAAGDSARPLAVIPVSPFGFAETPARSAAALAAAKRQPKGLARVAKALLIRGQYNWARRHFAGRDGAVALCWNGITGSRKAFMDGARDAGAETLYLERAPFPGRITLDPAGVNYGGSLSRDPEFYRDWAAGHTGSLTDWRRIKDTLTSRASRRADVGQAAATPEGRYLFVPLQVPNDSQVRLFSGWTGTLTNMIAEIASAAQALPEGWHIRLKEHPSARQSLAPALQAARTMAKGKLKVDNQTDTFAQVAGSEGVITLNSSVGLQAFFYDKPVIVLGQAVFGLPGLTHVVDGAEALEARLSAPETLRFDPALRDAFMTYLDAVYYPVAETQADGSVRIDPEVVRAKLGRISGL